MMNEDLRLPDVEVEVSVQNSTVAIFNFHLRPDIHMGYDIVTGITSKNERAAIRQILQDCITALNDTDWVSVDELHSLDAEETTEPPF